MALGLEDRRSVVAEGQDAEQSARSAVVADSRGVTVDAMTALRKEAREAGVWMKVVRNTLARRAVEGTEYECLKDSLVGPTLIAFSSEHPGAAARMFKSFGEENDAFELKAGAFEGELVVFSMLATLPTYEVAIAKVMIVWKEASTGKLVRTIAAIRDQKEEQAA